MNEICLKGNTTQCTAEFAAAAEVGMKLAVDCSFLTIHDAANIAESVGVHVDRVDNDYFVRSISRPRVSYALQVALQAAQKRQEDATKDVNRLFDLIQNSSHSRRRV